MIGSTGCLKRIETYLPVVKVYYTSPKNCFENIILMKLTANCLTLPVQAAGISFNYGNCQIMALPATLKAKTIHSCKANS